MVLTDLEMPEMDGFTLTSQIKKSSRLSQLPVLIHSSLSGTTNEDLVQKSRCQRLCLQIPARRTGLCHS